MIRYKADVLQLLKSAGYSSYRIRKENIFGQATLTSIRRGEMLSWDKLNLVCKLTGTQPGDLVEYIEDPEEDPKEKERVQAHDDARETDAETKETAHPMKL